MDCNGMAACPARAAAVDLFSAEHYINRELLQIEVAKY